MGALDLRCDTSGVTNAKRNVASKALDTGQISVSSRKALYLTLALGGVKWKLDRQL